MRTFKFHWLDHTVSIGKGTNATDAFTKLGYSSGAIRALDFWEEIKEIKVKVTE